MNAAQYREAIIERFCAMPEQKRLWGYDDPADYQARMPPASVENVLFHTIALCAEAVEELWTRHRQETEEMMRRQSPHTLDWYRRLALRFRGAAMWNAEATDARDEEQFITTPDTTAPVAFAAAAEEGGVIVIKIAGEDESRSPAPITQWVPAVQGWLDRVKDAGVPLKVRSHAPDRLALDIDVYTTAALVGEDAADGFRDKCRKAVEEYLRDLPFDGRLTLEGLRKAAAATDMAEEAEVRRCLWTNDFGETEVTHAATPWAGFFAIDSLDVTVHPAS